MSGSVTVSSPVTSTPVQATLDARYELGSFLPISAGQAAYNLPRDGVTEASTAILAAAADAISQGRSLSIPAGTYKWATNTPLEWKLAVGSLLCDGVTIDGTGRSTGQMLLISGIAGNVVNDASAHKVMGLILMAPTSLATTVDGLYIHDATNQVYGGSFVNMKIFNGRYGLNLTGSNNWLQNFTGCAIRNAALACINANPGTTAGENYSFFSCSISGCVNSGSGYAFIMDGNPTLNFTNTSFDYNDHVGLMTSGSANLLGCYIEDNSSSPMFRIRNLDANGAPTKLFIRGGKIFPSESSPRAYLFEVTGDTTGNQAVIDVETMWNGTYNKNHLIFKNNSSKRPRVRFRGSGFDNRTPSTTGSAVATFGAYTSQLVNGDFEASTSFVANIITPGGWFASTSANNTTTITTGTTPAGTNALKIVGASSVVSATASQVFPVKPGDEIRVSGWIDMTAYTSGTVTPRLGWFYATDTSSATPSQVTSGPAFTATTTGRVPFEIDAVVPQGFSVGYVDIQASSLTGTVYMDDVNVQAL